MASDVIADAISDEMIAKVRDRDVLNIIARVKEGKPLTSPQYERLNQWNLSRQAGEEMIEAPHEAKSIKALTDLLGISRKTFYKYRKESGAPPKKTNGMYNVSEWREFFQRLGVLDQDPADSPDGEEEEEQGYEFYRVELAKARLQNLLLDLAEREGLLVSSEGFATWLRERMMTLRENLMGIPNAAAPLVKGMDEPAIAELLMELITDAIDAAQVAV